MVASAKRLILSSIVFILIAGIIAFLPFWKSAPQPPPIFSAEKTPEFEGEVLKIMIDGVEADEPYVFQAGEQHDLVVFVERPEGISLPKRVTFNFWKSDEAFNLQSGSTNAIRLRRGILEISFTADLPNLSHDNALLVLKDRHGIFAKVNCSVLP